MGKVNDREPTGRTLWLNIRRAIAAQLLVWVIDIMPLETDADELILGHISAMANDWLELDR